MIEIDGSQKSGSGTILRLAIALAAITSKPLHIYNIRQNRSKPGLRPQHLKATLVAAKLCNAELEGAVLNSREIWFRPREILGGDIEVEIGTAGSISMLLMTVLPICAFAKETVRLRVTGGTDVPYSPTITYLQRVLIPTIKKMGFEVEIKIDRYGYYPKGNGQVTMTTKPKMQLQPIDLGCFGKLESIKGISICTFLEGRNVAERQAKAAHNHLFEKGYAARIQIVNDRSNTLQKGSSITLWGETTTGAILGADSIGELKKSSEAIGRDVSEKLLKELSAMPTVDIHMADMLIPYMALAEGKSTILTRDLSDHLETNIWLSEKILKPKFCVHQINRLFRIEKGD